MSQPMSVGTSGLLPTAGPNHAANGVVKHGQGSSSSPATSPSGSGSSGGPWTSMLDRQWSSGCNSVQPPRVHVAVCAKRCGVPGGIETLLRHAPSSSNSGGGGSGSRQRGSNVGGAGVGAGVGVAYGGEHQLNGGAAEPPSSVDLLSDSLNDVSFNTSVSSIHPSESSSRHDLTYSDSTLNSSGSSLGQGQGGGPAGFERQNSNNTSSRLISGRARSFAGKIARAAKASTDKIERGATALAIRYGTNDSNSNPDTLTAVLYVSPPHPAGNAAPPAAGMQGQQWEEWSRTEGVKLTPANHDRTAFSIPLQLPELYQPPHGQDRTVQVRLTLKSGSVNWSNKSYTVGCAHFSLSQLLNPKSPPRFASGVSSNVLSQHSNASVELCVLRNRKYPPLGGRGWSLSDPMPESCAALGQKFCPPIEQMYVYPTSASNALPLPDGSQQPRDDEFFAQKSIVAIERTQESTVVLPIATCLTRMLAESALVSAGHAEAVAKKVRLSNLAFSDPMEAFGNGGGGLHADCAVEVYHLVKFDLTGGAGGGPSGNTGGNGNLLGCRVRVFVQSPECVFERPVTNGEGRIPAVGQRTPRSNNASLGQLGAVGNLSVPFYPRRCPKIGSLRFQIAVDPPGGVDNATMNAIGSFTPNVGGNVSISTLDGGSGRRGSGGGQGGGGGPLYEARVEIDPYLDAPQGQQMIELPVHEIGSERMVGTLVIALSARSVGATPPQNNQDQNAIAPRGGLVEMLGMTSLTDGTALDSSIAHPQQQQQQQNPALGDLLSVEWIQNHARRRRADAETLLNRYNAYARAVSVPDPQLATTPPHQRKCPSGYRPSSGKMEPLLAGIPFNTHVQSLTIEPLLPGAATTYWHNVTCGAPADHFRGFTSSQNRPGGAGGARRLEEKRNELAQIALGARTDLRNGVAGYFKKHGGRRTHVKAGDGHVAQLRHASVRAEQQLADLTWELAARKANVFTQAVGIALTSYLAALSDSDRTTPQTAEVWLRHGFLLCFEGLLSAAGKEHGMIEDASKAIDMLRGVTVQLTDAAHDAGGGGTSSTNTAIAVEGSRVIRWVRLEWDAGNNAAAAARAPGAPGLVVHVSLEASFYTNRVPASLRNGPSSRVRFYPLLFQMGVDIRQWGANASSKIGSQITDKAMGGGGCTGPTTTGAVASIPSSSSGSNLAATSGTPWPEPDDEVEDDGSGGVPDNDFLVTLNYEAFRGLNRYAHAVRPVGNSEDVLLTSGTAFGGGVGDQQQQAIHPLLGVLWGNIRDSARRMEHGVLDSAAVAGERLGGSGIIFCKSGKDRTAMQATLKQAQFLSRNGNGGGAQSSTSLSPPEGGGGGNGDGGTNKSVVLADATLMRTHGTRLAVCEKNVGQPKYAFNALQAKFMPELLKPPLSSVAGFLKGGRIFSREGAIES